MKGKFFAAGLRRRRHDRSRPKRGKVDLELLRLETRWLLSTGPGIVEYSTNSSVTEPIGAVAGTDGNLWVTEYAAKSLVAFSPTGNVVKTVALGG